MTSEGFAATNRECGLLADGDPIPRRKVQAVKLQRTPQDLEPGVATRFELVSDLLITQRG